jgi:hypothetical protein
LTPASQPSSGAGAGTPIHGRLLASTVHDQLRERDIASAQLIPEAPRLLERAIE